MKAHAHCVLAIDVGNTTCHYGLVVDGHYKLGGALATAQLNGSQTPFQALLDQANAKGLPRPTGAAYCSVVPKVNATIEGLLAAEDLKTFHLRFDTVPGLGIAYPNPSEIGEDRLANSLAAFCRYGAPAIVIDMGTAVTFDIISKAGYEGGIIAPGLGLMTGYLHEQTALLPALNPADLVDLPGGIGKSTVEAMRLGCSVGFSGMVLALLERVEAELGARGEGKPTVLSTGGSVANLSRHWMQRTRFVDHLTLLGLADAFTHPDRL